MKILLDHNLDRRLKNYLPNHETTTALEAGWENVSNGRLIALAEESSFDVLLTADSKIRAQQNVAKRSIAIVVVLALDNRLKIHLEMLSEILITIEASAAGEIREVFHNKHPRGSG